jgi:chemotaxis protein CheX
MNVKFLNPFLEAVSDVLKAEVGIPSSRGSLTLQKSSLTAGEVTVLISIIGQVQGVVLYGMSQATALGIVSHIMGQEFKEFDNLAQSGIGELGNVISGKATVNLSNAGFQTTISPPTLIVGAGAQISTLDFSRIVVPMETELGQLFVHLPVREGTTTTAINIGPLVAGVKSAPVTADKNLPHNPKSAA